MDDFAGWQEEQRSAYLYRVLANIERGTPREKLFSELAREAENQARIWVERSGKQGEPAGYVPDLRTRLVARLTRRYGAHQMRTVLAAMKVRGMSVYSAADAGHPMPDARTGIERRHRGIASGGNLRAAVFGVNDGLVSNASLILGVAGAAVEPHVILLTGIAGLLAGALSMAAGEYVSMRSQRDMYEYQIGLERDELGTYPEEEAKELALIYEARGLPEDEAKRLADSMIADPKHGLDTLAREELGLNPDALGSPWGAAVFSCVSFASGALIPLLPFLFGASPNSLYVAIGLTAASLFAVGATLSLFTGRGALYGGLRMLAIGSAAGALTFAIGRLLGV